jgi:hypothetical protein
VWRLRLSRRSSKSLAKTCKSGSPIFSAAAPRLASTATSSGGLTFGPNLALEGALGAVVDEVRAFLNRLLVKLLYKGTFVLRAGLPHEIGRSDEAISRLQQHEADLKRLGVEHLYMFGSTARGEALMASSACVT